MGGWVGDTRVPSPDACQAFRFFFFLVLENMHGPWVTALPPGNPVIAACLPGLSLERLRVWHCPPELAPTSGLWHAFCCCQSPSRVSPRLHIPGLPTTRSFLPKGTGSECSCGSLSEAVQPTTGLFLLTMPSSLHRIICSPCWFCSVLQAEGLLCACHHGSPFRQTASTIHDASWLCVTPPSPAAGRRTLRSQRRLAE